MSLSDSTRGRHLKARGVMGPNVYSGPRRKLLLCPKCGAKPGWSCKKLRACGTDSDGKTVWIEEEMVKFHEERK